ncbi:unnamed protein product, partial [Symbiodinium necroappetens]
MRPRALLLLLPSAVASAIHSEVSHDGHVSHSKESEKSSDMSSSVNSEHQEGQYPTFGSSGFSSGGFGNSYGMNSMGGGMGGGMGGSYGNGFNSYGSPGPQGYGQPMVRSGNPMMARSGQPQSGYAPTETEMHMPLGANVELHSDDGVLYSSRRRAEKKPEDYNYDDNTVLGMANYIYKGDASLATL